MELESAFEGRTSSKFTPLSPLASPSITACCIFDRAAPSCDQSLPAAFVYTLPPPSRCWSRIPAGEPAASLGIALDPPSALPSPGQPCQCPALAQPPAQPHCPAPLPCPLPSPWCRAGPPASRNRTPHARPAAAAAPVQQGWAGMTGAEQSRGASALPQPCPACSVQQVLLLRIGSCSTPTNSRHFPPCNPAASLPCRWATSATSGSPGPLPHCPAPLLSPTGLSLMPCRPVCVEESPPPPLKKRWAGTSGAGPAVAPATPAQPCPACSVQQVLQHSQAAAQSQPTPPCNPATSPLADGPEAQAGAGCRGPGSQLPQPQAGVPGPLLVLWR